MTTHSVNQWNDSIDQFVQQIRGTHPDPFAKTGSLAFMRDVNDFKQHMGELSEEERMVRAMRIVASLGDGHTDLQPARADFGKWYPIHIVEFPDGYFVTSALKSYDELAGAQVISMADKPIAQVASAVRSLASADNEFGARWNLGSLHNAALMRGLGFARADDSISVKFKLADGRVKTEELPAMLADSAFYSPGFSRNDWEDGAETLGPPLASPTEWITAYRGEPASAFRVRDDTHPIHLTLRRALVSRNLPQFGTYYIQSNIVEDGADESFRHFFARAMDEIDSAHPKNVILDLRNNPGGDGSRIPELIPLFSRHLASTQNLFILTGPKTFSAAILWLGDFARFLHPSIVGEPAGAALNSFGDAHEFPIPDIGATIHISTLRNVKSGVLDTSTLTPVDVPAPMTFADWRTGRDPAVDQILQGKEMRSFAQIALVDGADAAQRAMAERVDVFKKYSWWTPPPEIELRYAVQLLREQHRFDDAIAIGKISVRFHPEIWNSWYNLGQAQLEAGRLLEGQKTLAKVLEVDPNNFNKDELADIFARDPAKEFSVPPLLQWGSSLESLKPVLDANCTAVSSEKTPAHSPQPGHEVLVVTCHDYLYLGSKHDVSLTFVDDRLASASVRLPAIDPQKFVASIEHDLHESPVDKGSYLAFPQHLTFISKSGVDVMFCSTSFRGELERHLLH
ncbi:MAG: hypothetical protein ABJB01_00270 [Rudaea sp.]